MNSHSLSEIKREIEQIGRRLGCPRNCLPTFGFSEDFGCPHIEVNASGLHYVVVERGVELERKTTHDLNDLLYIVFEAVTFSMAGDYELKHRIPGQDSRRILFRRQLELLGSVDADWVTRLRQDQHKILACNPFNDGVESAR
ncbi:hypothetical protein ETAA8_70350 [Anatilimnocola aggregata]|uniref:Immunity protein 63 domain-containing protein n=1 Tax=Anatilimnocola aggregata TaxID=2528021 RepID=A0A517YNS0_9BACT|nr:Imm63 family immunity protein [Anatilimnocola aggregata]QDU31874.1 hypothetical protein ETAA8_70350 [Anatilimnocola aggregata]